jgi:SP family arabinose:H+ symporter-like MFS transporter
MTRPDSSQLRYVWFLATTAATGGLLFGFDIAIISGAGPFLREHFHMGDWGLGSAFSALLWGCAIGCALAGYLADRIGRRRLLLVVAALFAVTSVQTGLAWSVESLLLARFLGGLAVGAVSLLSPMYISEVAPPAMRGRLSTLYQMSIVTGILVSYCINYGLRTAGPDNWRWMFASGVVPSVLFLALLTVAPETPRYLLMRGARAAARSILERVGADAERALVEISASLAAPRGGWRELLQPSIRRALWVGFGLAILVHFSGINTVIDYAPTIFQSAGWRVDAALLSTFVIGVTNFLFTIVSFWTIDRFGRRPLYIGGSLGMAGTLGVLTVAAWLNHFQGPIVLILILAYLVCFCSCIGPVFWTLLPEIYPNRVRGTAMVVPVLTQWIANAIVVQVFPAALHRIGPTGTFGLLALVSLAQALFAWRWVPETKQRSLEQIELFWEASSRKGQLWPRASSMIEPRRNTP